MSLIFILTLALQAGLIVHVIKTGRNNLWIWAIALLPAAGSLAYIGVEILPEIFGGRTARRTKASMQRIIDPDRDLRQAAAAVEFSGNVDARRRLAEELYERGQYAEAAAVYQGGLTGIFEHDPVLLLGLAGAQFASGEFGPARASLERLMLHNPEFKSADGHLLYARTLEAQDALEEAEREYAAAAPGYPGAEARVRYALLLKRRGKVDDARSILKDLLDAAKLGPPHYRKAQAEWRPVKSSAMTAAPRTLFVTRRITHFVSVIFAGARIRKANSSMIFALCEHIMVIWAVGQRTRQRCRACGEGRSPLCRQQRISGRLGGK